MCVVLQAFCRDGKLLTDGSCVSTDRLARDWRCIVCFRELRFDTPFLLPVYMELFSTYLLV